MAGRTPDLRMNPRSRPPVKRYVVILPARCSEATATALRTDHYVRPALSAARYPDCVFQALDTIRSTPQRPLYGRLADVR